MKVLFGFYLSCQDQTKPCFLVAVGCGWIERHEL